MFGTVEERRRKREREVEYFSEMGAAPHIGAGNLAQIVTPGHIIYVLLRFEFTVGSKV